MFDFIDKWLKKTVLTHGCKGGDHEDLQGRRRRRRKRKRKHSTIKLSCEIRIEKNLRRRGRRRGRRGRVMLSVSHKRVDGVPIAMAALHTHNRLPLS